jgi:hypothetical protein
MDEEQLCAGAAFDPKGGKQKFAAGAIPFRYEYEVNLRFGTRPIALLRFRLEVSRFL